jgi:aminoglycoside 3-N-acetyltransferase
MLEPPITARRIAADLRALGLRRGDAVLVHSSLRSLSGPRSMVVGGAVGVIDALLDALGPAGTLIMPTFSSYLSEPSHWTQPPAPPDWWPIVRAHLPPYRRDATPSQGVGVVPEVFRAMAGVVRSAHPQASFSAHGPHAREIVEPHPLADPLGEGSPLGRLHAMDARVLMLGAPWRGCTAFHLGELRAGLAPTSVRQGAPVQEGSSAKWVEWSEPLVSVDGFGPVGDAFERSRAVASGMVGRAHTRLFSVRAAVDFAEQRLPAVR